MFKMTYKSPSERIVFEADCESPKAAFGLVARLQELFEEPCCGDCQSPHIRHKKRVAKGFDFYELVCSDCGARLSFGQTLDKENLFPKRMDEERRPIGKNGWYHYEGDRQQDDAPPPQQVQQPQVQQAPATEPPQNGNRAPAGAPIGDAAAMLAWVDRCDAAAVKNYGRPAEEMKKFLLDSFKPKRIAEVSLEETAKATQAYRDKFLTKKAG